MTTESATAEGPIVLVHGAWVGEWCWEPLQRALRGSRRTIRAVSLTGHGKRSAESGPHVGLDTHADDVVAAIEADDLHDVTLVGHSYGGRVITRAWRRLGGRIAAMVYLDAHAPIGPGTRSDRTAAPVASGDRMIEFGDFPPTAEVLGGDTALAEFYARLMPQSAQVLDEPFFERLPDDLPKVYVAATADTNDRFHAYHAAAAADPHWRLVELAATHWLIYSHSREIAAVILAAASPSDRRSSD